MHSNTCYSLHSCLVIWKSWLVDWTLKSAASISTSCWFVGFTVCPFLSRRLPRLSPHSPHNWLRILLVLEMVILKKGSVPIALSNIMVPIPLFGVTVTELLPIPFLTFLEPLDWPFLILNTMLFSSIMANPFIHWMAIWPTSSLSFLKSAWTTIGDCTLPAVEQVVISS